MQTRTILAGLAAVAVAGMATGAASGPASGARAVHQPGLFVLPAGRQAARRLADAQRHPRPVLQRRLLGLSRLEGHPCQPRFFRAPEGLRRGARRPPGLHAADGRQRRRARRRQQPAGGRGGDRARRGSACRCRSISRSTDDAVEVKIGAASGANAKGTHLAGDVRQRRQRADRARREPRRDHHLPQCRPEGPADRHVEGRGDAVDLPKSEQAQARTKRCAVLLQAETAAGEPGPILGVGVADQ